MNLDIGGMDNFFRLFLVPGLQHCAGGFGAVNMGQWAGTAPTDVSSTPRADNVLLALVNWVEDGIAPDIITGQIADGTSTRMHCRYPQKST